MEKLENNKSGSKSLFIKLVIWALIQIVLWNLKPSGALTVEGVHTIAAFAGLIFGLIFIEQYAIPCIASAIIMTFSGAYPTVLGCNSAFVAGFGNDTFVWIFSIQLVGGIIAYTGLAKVIAMKMINAKFAAGRPYMLTLVIYITTAILSLFIHPLVIIIVMCELVVEIFRNLNMKISRWTMFVITDLAIIGILAQNVMPFQLGPSLFYGLLSSFDERLALSNVLGQHMVTQFMILVFWIALSMLAVRLFCNKFLDEVRRYEPSDQRFTFNNDQKIALWIMIGYVFFQLLPVVLPNGTVKTFLNTFGLSGWSGIAALAAMMIFKKDGSPFITFEKMTKSGINWYMLMMLFGLGATTAPMMSETTGIIQWLSDILTPICQSVSGYSVYAILILFGLIISNFTDNIAVIYIELPILYTIALATKMSPIGLLEWVIPAIQLAILIPAASPHIALAFGQEHTGYVKRNQMIPWMIPRIVAGAVLMLTIGWAMQGWYPTLIF